MVGLRDASCSVLTTVAESGALPEAVRAGLRSTVANPSAVTLAFLSAISLIAILVQDIGFIVGVSGALLGAAIVYIYPALIYGAASGQSIFAPVYALVPLGAFLGVLGVWQTLK